MLVVISCSVADSIKPNIICFYWFIVVVVGTRGKGVTRKRREPVVEFILCG